MSSIIRYLQYIVFIRLNTLVGYNRYQKIITNSYSSHPVHILQSSLQLGCSTITEHVNIKQIIEEAWIAKENIILQLHIAILSYVLFRLNFVSCYSCNNHFNRNIIVPIASIISYSLFLVVLVDDKWFEINFDTWMSEILKKQFWNLFWQGPLEEKRFWRVLYVVYITRHHRRLII